MTKAPPDFLGIGAQKAGTTWLHAQCCEHPDIWVPPIKEVHYFDRATSYPSPQDLATSPPLARWFGKHDWERPRMLRGAREMWGNLREGDRERLAWNWKWYFGRYDDRWYRSLFPSHEDCPISGEITPEYSILEPEDVARIHALNPEIKLIFLLRNPIERSWSSVRYNSSLGFNRINLDSHDDVIAEMRSNRLTRRCDYERTLETYLAHFPARQILIGFFDAIRDQPGALLDGVWDFLGARKLEQATESVNKVFNDSPGREMPAQVREVLVEMYLPKIRRLSERLGSYATVWRDEIESPGAAKPASLSPVVRLDNEMSA
jgi:hypothetical protein